VDARSLLGQSRRPRLVATPTQMATVAAATNPPIIIGLSVRRPNSDPEVAAELIDAKAPALKADANDPAEAMEATEPAAPKDKIEPALPTDPIERKLPVDPIDRNESVDHSDQREPHDFSATPHPAPWCLVGTSRSLRRSWSWAISRQASAPCNLAPLACAPTRRSSASTPQ